MVWDLEPWKLHSSQGDIGTTSSLDSNTAVYDPFDGSFLGSTLAPDRNVQPEEEGNSDPVTVKNEELWSHLSGILDLQNQISRMHMEMEEIGMTGDSRPKGKGRSRAASVSHIVIEDMEGDGGIGLTRDEEAEKNKAREEQFSKLANQFRGKKEAINGIMAKLDTLSRAVTEFHTLQAPRIDFPSSPQNSVPDASPTSHSDIRSRELPSVLVVKGGTPRAPLVESPLSVLPP
ncbi:hypothetical protein FB45DRAFT_917302 [Roridomyces roridus]|uniref:Uncharacterized protein n=1 Tax=Roridomyces roridus TaxID=1738132 RepID=A0AAD7BUX2_9AGAR|nr:hypothetical protein FB45DRAFT_917302 [Roridomyces roridus]